MMIVLFQTVFRHPPQEPVLEDASAVADNFIPTALAGVCRMGEPLQCRWLPRRPCNTKVFHQPQSPAAVPFLNCLFAAAGAESNMQEISFVLNSVEMIPD